MEDTKIIFTDIDYKNHFETAFEYAGTDPKAAEEMFQHLLTIYGNAPDQLKDLAAVLAAKGKTNLLYDEMSLWTTSRIKELEADLVSVEFSAVHRAYTTAKIEADRKKAEK